MSVEGATDLARALATAIQHSRHYGPSHRSTVGSIEELFVKISGLLGTLNTLRIEVNPDWLWIATAAIPREDVHAGPLTAHLMARRVQSLLIRPEVSARETAELVRLLALEPEALIASGGLAEALAAAGVYGIDVVEARPGPRQLGSLPIGGAVPAAVSALERLMDEAARTQPLDLARARQAIENLADALSRDPPVVWRAVAGRTHDELDPMHAVATAVMVLGAAEAMEVLDQPRIDLGMAALLHDIGLAVLSPPARGRERTVEGAQDSWRHPAEGGYLLRDAEGGGSLAMIVAMEHHLPALHRSNLLFQSQLVGLADYVDAMTSARVPGLRRLTMDAVMDQLIRGKGPQFDPVHVRVLAAVLHDAAIAGADFWG